MPDLIRINAAGHRAWQGDRELVLPHMQFALLAHLVANAGAVVTNQTLLCDVWRRPDSAGSKTVGMHIAWLRRHLGEDAKAPTYITNVRGLGYRFEPSMVTPAVLEAGSVEYRLPLRVGRQTPHQTVYDANEVMVAAGMTPGAAAWLVQTANHAFEMEVQ